MICCYPHIGCVLCCRFNVEAHRLGDFIHTFFRDIGLENSEHFQLYFGFYYVDHLTSVCWI